MSDGYIEPVTLLRQINTITDKYRFSQDQIRELVDSSFGCGKYDEIKMVVIPIHADEEGLLYDIVWSSNASSHSQLTNARSVFSSISLKPNGSNQFSFSVSFASLDTKFISTLILGLLRPLLVEFLTRGTQIKCRFSFGHNSVIFNYDQRSLLPIQRLDHLTLTNHLVNALAHENTFIGFNSTERAWIYYTNLGGENALVSGTSHAEIVRLYSIDQRDILQKGDTYYEINNLADSIVIRDYARDLFDENNYRKLVKQIRMFHPKKEIRVRLVKQGTGEAAYHLIQDHEQ